MIHFLLNYFNFNLNYTNVLQLDYNFFIYCIHMQNSFFQHINYINEQQGITMFANYFLIFSLLILLYFFYKELIVKNIDNVFFINQIIPLVIIFTCIITPNNIFFISIFLWFLFFLTLSRFHNFYLFLSTTSYTLWFWYVLYSLNSLYTNYKIIINNVFIYIFRRLRIILNFDFIFSSTRWKFIWIFYNSESSRSYEQERRRKRYYANKRAHARFFKRYYKSMNFNDSSESLLYFENKIRLLKCFFYFFFKKIFKFISFFSSWPFTIISIIFHVYFEVKKRKFSNTYYVHEIILFMLLLITALYFKLRLFCIFCIFICFCFFLLLYLNGYHEILFSILKGFVIFSFGCSFILYIFKIYNNAKHSYNKFKSTHRLLKKKHGSFTNYCSYHEYIQKRILLKGFSKYFKRTDFNDSFINRKNINSDNDWFIETWKSFIMRLYFIKQAKEDKAKEKKRRRR